MTGHVKGNRRDLFEKKHYVLLLEEPYFYFKRNRDKENMGKKLYKLRRWE
jgi:hypothetical protein